MGRSGYTEPSPKANQSTSLIGERIIGVGALCYHPMINSTRANSLFHTAHNVAAENISAKKVVSIRVLSRMSIFVAGNI